MSNLKELELCFDPNMCSLEKATLSLPSLQQLALGRATAQHDPEALRELPALSLPALTSLSIHQFVPALWDRVVSGALASKWLRQLSLSLADAPDAEQQPSCARLTQAIRAGCWPALEVIYLSLPSYMENQADLFGAVASSFGLKEIELCLHENVSSSDLTKLLAISTLETAFLLGFDLSDQLLYQRAPGPPVVCAKLQSLTLRASDEQFRMLTFPALTRLWLWSRGDCRSINSILKACPALNRLSLQLNDASRHDWQVSPHKMLRSLELNRWPPNADTFLAAFPSLTKLGFGYATRPGPGWQKALLTVASRALRKLETLDLQGCPPELDAAACMDLVLALPSLLCLTLPAKLVSAFGKQLTARLGRLGRAVIVESGIAQLS